MFETLASIGLLAGFVFVLKLVAGPDPDERVLTGVFNIPSMHARPRGVQETDLAPFAFRDPQPEATTSVRVRAHEGRMDPARAA